MTVIAYDGRTLAADRQGTAGGYKFAVTKLARIGSRRFGFAGDMAYLPMLISYFKGNGAWPEFQKDKDTRLYTVMIRDGRIWKYESQPEPFQIFAEHYATGAGRDYATAAMHCGKTAAEAVQIASIYEESCGLGVDTLD